VVVTACDGLDGTKDGLIADPFACSRQPRSIECAPGQTSTAASFCLTAEQVSTVTKLYRGPADSHGRLLYPGWHGLADPAISPVGTIAYYQAVQNFMGGAARTSDFARLFMLPGVGHCGGGDGPDSFNGLGALVDWVEQGQAPTSLLTGKVVNGQVTQTQPVYQYPLIAVDTTGGPVTQASSYTPQQPPVSFDANVKWAAPSAPATSRSAAGSAESGSAALAKPARPSRHGR